jgi:hypothetical protein
MLGLREIDGAAENVEDTAVLFGAGLVLEAAIHPLRVAVPEVGDAADAEVVEIEREAGADARNRAELL